MDDTFDQLAQRYRTDQGYVDKQMLHARGVLSDNNLFDDDDLVNPNPLRGAPLYDARGFWVDCTVDGRGVGVAVLWGGELEPGTVAIRGWDAALVEQWLADHAGEEVEVTATGPFLPLDPNDPLAVLGAFHSMARLRNFRGDLPPGYPEPEPGVVH